MLRSALVAYLSKTTESDSAKVSCGRNSKPNLVLQYQAQSNAIDVIF